MFDLHYTQRISTDCYSSRTFVSKSGYSKATLRGPDRVPLYVTSPHRLDILDGIVLLQNATFNWVAWLAGQVRRDEFLLSKEILCGDTNMRPERNIFDRILLIYFR